MFRYDGEGRPRRYRALAQRLDYCDSYGLAVNAALDVEPTGLDDGDSWWDRFLEWAGLD